MIREKVPHCVGRLWTLVCVLTLIVMQSGCTICYMVMLSNKATYIEEVVGQSLDIREDKEWNPLILTDGEGTSSEH